MELTVIDMSKYVLAGIGLLLIIALSIAAIHKKRG